MNSPCTAFQPALLEATNKSKQLIKKSNFSLMEVASRSSAVYQAVYTLGCDKLKYTHGVLEENK